MDFRARLVATLSSARPLLEIPDVVIVGSEVPNLLQPSAESTLVVSQDLDIGVPIARHAEVKARLSRLLDAGFRPSPEEPSVWIASDPLPLEINFVGIDPATRDASETYVLEDPELPLMVFGPLGIVVRARVVDVDGIPVPLPSPVALALEKLVTDRSGEKGERDLLVALGLLEGMDRQQLDELVAAIRALPRARSATESMQRRAKAVRARAAVRRWEYRQRHTAHGVWYRFRMLLIHAEEAWAISAEDAETLMAEGLVPEPVGRELAPQKHMLIVTRERLATLTSKSRLAMHLDAPMLAARHIALVPFP